MKTGNRRSTARVRLHRKLFRQAGITRLEVAIGADVVSEAKALALKQACPVWQIVEAALIAYVAGNSS